MRPRTDPVAVMTRNTLQEFARARDIYGIFFFKKKQREYVHCIILVFFCVSSEPRRCRCKAEFMFGTIGFYPDGGHNE